MSDTPKPTIEIEGEERSEPYHPKDSIVTEVDSQLKENPFKLTSADYRDLIRPSFGDSVSYTLFGGFFLLAIEMMVKVSVGNDVEVWKPYACIILLLVGLVVKVQGPKLLDRKLKRIRDEMESHFEKQRSYVKVQKARLDKYEP